MKNRHLEQVVLTSALLVIMLGIYTFSPTITGFVAKTFTFQDDINLVVTTSTNYTWEPQEDGLLTGLTIDGKLQDNGTAKVYLLHEGIKYVVYDSSLEKKKTPSSGISSITGLVVGIDPNETRNETEPVNVTIEIIETVVNETPINDTQEFNNLLNDSLDLNVSLGNQTTINETLNDTFLNETTINETTPFNETNVTPPEPPIINETVNKSISLILEYNSNSLFDSNDDGIETLNGVVDLTVTNTQFSWGVDDSKLCTRWRIFSEEEQTLNYVCYGFSDCCAFLNLEQNGEWNSPYYSTINKNGETENNLVGTQVVYYDVNLSPENLKADIVYSDWENLAVRYSSGQKFFTNECVDTCTLPKLAGKEYTLLIELIGEATLTINTLDYQVEREVNTPPKFVQNVSNITLTQESSTTLDLSQYFVDGDGDVLLFDHYRVDDLKIVIQGENATITAPLNYTGKKFLFFTANDTESMTTSNVFMVEVVAQPPPKKTEDVQLFAKIGEPVKWRKFVGNNGSLTLPAYIMNFSVNKIVAGQKVGVNNNKLQLIQGGKVKKLRDFLREQEGRNIRKVLSQEPRLQNRLALLDLLTNNASQQQAAPIDIFINDTGEIEVEYFTEPPILEEIKTTPNNKEVRISSEVHYVNITAFTSIPEARKELVKLYRTTNGTKEPTKIRSYNDTNSNGLIDYIEWVVPHLSNQTYEIIIEIIEAVHLDENYTFIQNIFDEVSDLDDVWSPPIYTDEYVRVTFQKPLDFSRDITIYVRNNQSLNTKVEVYHYNSTTKITQFPVITASGRYTIYLTGMIGSHDLFDLKVVNENNLSTFLEFDYIVDPITTVMFFDEFSDLSQWTLEHSTASGWAVEGGNAEAGDAAVSGAGLDCGTNGGGQMRQNMTITNSIDLSDCVSGTAFANWTQSDGATGALEATDCLNFQTSNDGGTTWDSVQTAWCDDDPVAANGYEIPAVDLTSTFKWRFMCQEFEGGSEQINLPMFNITCDVELLNITQNLNTTTPTPSSEVFMFGYMNLTNGVNASNTKVNVSFEGTPMGMNNVTVNNRLYSFNFTDADSTGFSLGVDDHVTTNSQNVTLNITEDATFKRNKTGNFTSRAFSGSGVIVNWTTLTWNADLRNSSDVVGLAYAQGDQDLAFFVRNKSYVADTTHTNIISDTDSLTVFEQFNILGGYDHDDIIGVSYDDDAIDVAVFFIDGRYLQDSSQGNLDSAVDADDAERTYTFPSNWNYTDVVGFAYEATGSGDPPFTEGSLAAFFNNGSYISDTDVDFNGNIDFTGTYSFSGEYSIPSGWSYHDIIGFADDDNDDDIAVFFRNGSFAVDTSQATFDSNIVFTSSTHEAALPSDVNGTSPTNITFHVRTSDDSTTWSSWNELITLDGYRGEKISYLDVSPSRYLEYKAILRTPDPYISPNLLNVSVNYTTLSTDHEGNYNFTFTVPNDLGIYNVDLNATFAGFTRGSTAFLTVTAAGCICPSSGDWNLDFADNCVLTTDCDLKGNDVHASGSGTWELKAAVRNYGTIYAHTGTIICRKSPCIFR